MIRLGDDDTEAIEFGRVGDGNRRLNGRFDGAVSVVVPIIEFVVTDGRPAGEVG